MTLYVVDASVAIKWYVPEVHSETAACLLDGDCFYLVLALTQQCQMVTADGKFYNALKTSSYASNLLRVENI